MSDKYLVTREPNYTISIKDRNNKSICFRDITGKDLEVLERFFEKGNELTSECVISVLELINLSDIPVKKLTPRVIKEIFEIVSKEIFCNFMPKIKWLELCYALQNNSFVAIDFFESQPMTKVMAMLQVHQNAIAEIRKSQK
jgi:hypothetical protein